MAQERITCFSTLPHTMHRIIRINNLASLFHLPMSDDTGDRGDRMRLAQQTDDLLSLLLLSIGNKTSAFIGAWKLGASSKKKRHFWVHQ